MNKRRVLSSPTVTERVRDVGKYLVGCKLQDDPIKRLKAVMDNDKIVRISTAPKTFPVYMDSILVMAGALIDGNTGFDKGKLTRQQLDHIVTNDVSRGLVIQPNLLLMSDVPLSLRALILIDGVLKPENIEVFGGYQNARLSYIPEANLKHYYLMLDKAREVYPEDAISRANFAAHLYNQHISINIYQ